MKKLREKATLLQTTEDFAERTSIHGIGYVFDRSLNSLDRLLWLLLLLVFLGLATGITWNTWTQWTEQQVVTTLKNIVLIFVFVFSCVFVFVFVHRYM